jgi:CheY-like chemotaxis protein
MSNSGGDFLAKKSGLMRTRGSRPDAFDALIVDDEALDADRMLGTLRVMLGYDASVRRASDVDRMLFEVTEKKPDLVFLDDILKPSDDATKSLPLLKAAKYDGPVIVISGQVTKTRRAQLMALGAYEVIHKDDVDSVRLTEVLQRLFSA